MKLASHLDRIMAILGRSDTELAREFKLNRNHLRKVRENSFEAISRKELQIFMTLARRARLDFLSVAPDPVWETFIKADVTIVRGERSLLRWDAPAEQELGEYVRGVLEGRPAMRTGANDVVPLMRNQNCIFIGSPRANEGSEQALARLWEATPFDESPENRGKLPFRFVWPEWEPPARASAVIEPMGAFDPGILIAPRPPATQHFVEVTRFRSHDLYLNANRGRDGGVIVVVRKPFQTDNNVTTIVVAGYSGLATLEIARDLINEGIDVDEESLRPGVPIVRILTFEFDKRQGHDRPVARRRGRAWHSAPWRHLPRVDSTQAMASKRSRKGKSSEK